MLEDGQRYVVYSSDTLYGIPNSSCAEGSTVTLSNTNVIRYKFINGKWYAQDQYNINNYGSSSYICHVYNSYTQFHNPSEFVLPAVIVSCLLFSVIYHWFLRLRG